MLLDCQYQHNFGLSTRRPRKAEVVPLPGSINIIAGIWQLQNVGVECGSSVRGTKIEGVYVHSGLC